MGSPGTITAVLFLLLGQVPAPPAPDQPPIESPAASSAAPQSADEAPRRWSFSAAAYAYFIPDQRDYIQPTVTADRGRLHLEARYNYEAHETGSAWVGYNFKSGEELSLELTPMLGGVFGDTNGIAPGYRLLLGYWKLELSSEGEYLFDLGDEPESFFYNWSELSISPLEWFRIGLASQRTRVYQTGLEVQRGILLGFTYKQLDFTAYVFNLGWEDPTLVFSAALSF
jgi:hypothetical protein